MYRIIDSKSTGKTGRLLLLAKEKDGIVVCANPVKLRDKAYRYGIVGVDFISYQQYISNEFVSTKPIFIDEMDKFLEIYDPRINGYTISED